MAHNRSRSTAKTPNGAAFVLAIVGAGPTCTYALERLAAVLLRRDQLPGLVIQIFDRDGDFGSGQTHSARQPRTSVLNRICGQISFGADHTNRGVVEAPSLAPYENLHHWCRARYAATADPQYRLDAESWPFRHIHGQALEEAFGVYVDHLRDGCGAQVQLHADEVVDVEPGADGRLSVLTAGGVTVVADHILFATGHGAGIPRAGSLESHLATLAAEGAGSFIEYAYPLDRRIPSASGDPQTIGVLGLGLTAIDVILYLTEGRGGQFVPGANGLEYRPSGMEPAAIVGFCRSGLFTFARARNQKEFDPAALEHRGRFFTTEAIDRLRETAGTPIDIPGFGLRLQLNFEHHVLPLMLIEMRYVYYRALFGPAFASAFEAAVDEQIERFITTSAQGPWDSGGFEATIDPLVDGVMEAIAVYLETCDYSAGAARCGVPDFNSILEAYFGAILGRDFVARESGRWDYAAAICRLEAASPSLFDLDPFRHRFDWQHLCDPIPRTAHLDSGAFTEAVVAFMELDHRRAHQGNIDNPSKAACDGIWRDLRSTLTHVVDHGGLTAESHQRFLIDYMRLHNRLANGACLEVMEKMLALIKGGQLDVGVGPLTTIERAPDRKGFRVVGTAGTRDVDLIVDGKLHGFDPQHDESLLYRRIFSRSLVRHWRNPAGTGGHFEPGGLDLSNRFHPIGADGAEDPRITFLGPPTEGILFFQVGAARPNQNHHVLNDVIAWVEEFVPRLFGEDDR